MTTGVQAAARAGGLVRPRRALSRPAVLGLLGVAPSLLLIGGLVLYPVGYAVWLDDGAAAGLRGGGGAGADELKTLPVGVQDLFSAAVVDWGLIMAAGLLITVPALGFFLAVQRHLVAGWGTGGLRG